MTQSFHSRPAIVVGVVADYVFIKSWAKKFSCTESEKSNSEKAGSEFFS